MTIVADKMKRVMSKPQVGQLPCKRNGGMLANEIDRLFRPSRNTRVITATQRTYTKFSATTLPDQTSTVRRKTKAIREK